MFSASSQVHSSSPYHSQWLRYQNLPHLILEFGAHGQCTVQDIAHVPVGEVVDSGERRGFLCIVLAMKCGNQDGLRQEELKGDWVDLLSDSIRTQVIQFVRWSTHIMRFCWDPHLITQGDLVHDLRLQACYNPGLLFQDGSSVSPESDGFVEPSPILLGWRRMQVTLCGPVDGTHSLQRNGFGLWNHDLHCCMQILHMVIVKTKNPNGILCSSIQKILYTVLLQDLVYSLCLAGALRMECSREASVEPQNL